MLPPSSQQPNAVAEAVAVRLARVVDRGVEDALGVWVASEVALAVTVLLDQSVGVLLLIITLPIAASSGSAIGEQALLAINIMPIMKSSENCLNNPNPYRTQHMFLCSFPILYILSGKQIAKLCCCLSL